MQIHASRRNANFADFHYFRVREAKEWFDLILDSHVQKLREKTEVTSSVGETKVTPSVEKTKITPSVRETEVIPLVNKSSTLFLITGRGKHSEGNIPRVKLAVMERLGERGLT